MFKLPPCERLACKSLHLAQAWRAHNGFVPAAAAKDVQPIKSMLLELCAAVSELLESRVWILIVAN